jgi:hypothetical protein
MAPASLLNDEDRALRIKCFEERTGTTHVPFAAIYSRSHEPVTRDGQPCPYDTGLPKIQPFETQRLLQMVGSERY